MEKNIYTGAKTKFIKEGDVPKIGVLKSAVDAVITPKPNSSILGISRPKLWLYEVTDTPKGKGLRYFVRNTLGEPPVLYSKVKPSETVSLIKNRLENNGYFRSEVNYEVKEKKRTAGIIYTATLHSPYRIDSIKFPLRTSSVNSKILEDTAKTLIKSGDIYNLNLLKAERQRIDQYLKNEGFFYFNPDYLVFYADTAIGNRKVNLSLEVKDDAPEKSLQRYRMNVILINPKFSLDNDTIPVHSDTVLIDDKYYINADSTFKPRVITGSVFFNRNQYYSRRDHDITLRRLMGLGVFKFVNIKFEDQARKDTSF